jgi:aminoglycoside phosphotransferase family enzyme/predicted kinase
MPDSPRATGEVARLLGDPAAYDPPPASVRVVQTHGSFVFLTGRWAFKMKRAVKYAFFDFSTLEKRREALERELRLNRRLAPEVYLDVLPVVERGGRLAVGRAGEAAVEYLLRMAELPEERFLPALLARGEQGAPLLRRAAEAVAGFHLGAERGEGISRHGRPGAVRRLLLGNLEEAAALPAAQRPDEEAAGHCRAAFGRLLGQLEGVIRRRAEEGFVRDLHGDLRMEHVVFLGERVVVFDCLDFRDDFRCMDTIHEAAALVMELVQAGYRAEARAFLRAYLDRTGDDASLPLLALYFLHRALVRGKVEAIQAACAAPPAGGEGAAARARGLFGLAGRVAAQERRPRLVLIGGLMATGKSALAQGLGGAAGVAAHHSDRVRKELAGLAPTAPRREPWGRGLYGQGMSGQVYAELLARARRDLAGGRDAVVDASFARRADRAAFARLAEEAGARLRWVECACPPGERRGRLERREAKGASVSDGRPEIMEAQEAVFEPWEEERVVVDTSGPKEESLKAALRALYFP